MKIARHIRFTIALLAGIILTGCGEDRTKEYMEMTKENQWIYSTMKEVYMWRDEIKQPEHNQFFGTTSKFFSSLLHSDDKVSYFTDTLQSASYGISYTLMRDPIAEQPSKVYALALFVEPGSPAEIAGIERGTWISAIDGKALSISKTDVLKSGGQIKLTTEYIDYNDEEMRYRWQPSDTLTMHDATETATCNIILDTIYDIRDRKAGYILCNNFDGDDFVRKAEDIFQDFTAGGVTDIILDLRYNNGGSIENAAMLASALVPSELHGKPFAILGKSDEKEDTVYNYMTNDIMNQGDKRLYFITGNNTCGTAELFISSIDNSRNMYDVLTVGVNTKGDNIIVKSIKSPFGFTINPATAFMYTSQGKMIPTEGLKADYQLNELGQITHVYPLGTEQEYLLYNTLHLIVNGTLPQ